MRKLILAVCFISFQNCFAQRVVDVTNGDVKLGQNAFFAVNGTPFVNSKYISLVDGTPYFKDDWMKGVLIGNTEGEQYKSSAVKLDLFDNKIHFQDEQGTDMITTSPIRELVITDASGNNFKFVNSSTFPQTATDIKQGWYLWLCSGTATLYKFFQKNSYEVTPYNSATTELHIKTTEQYLVLYNNALIEIKKLKDAPNVLANKKAELEIFLKEKDDKTASMDDRFTRLIDYYNSFFKEKK